jgi:hypothetical protein
VLFREKNRYVFWESYENHKTYCVSKILSVKY